MKPAPETVLEADRQDVLRATRSAFELPADTIYLDGNSLGPLTTAARKRVAQVLEQQWGQSLIASWNQHGWIDLPQRVGDKIAPLIGAGPGQTICCDSISVNLHKLISAALLMRPGRSRVVSQIDNFPTDLYTVEGLQNLLGVSRCTLQAVPADQLEQHLTDEVAVLMLTHVNFRSGAMHDMQRLTQLAHDVGALVVWDLAHSAGALPLALDAWHVDFAVGCGYKFLNGGPGAPAFVYVAERHQAAAQQPLSGWMGHKEPFAFEPQYVAAEGVERFLSGTPSILSMAALDAALEVFDEVDMQALRKKSVALAELLIELVDQHPSLAELQLVTPQQAEHRGSQVAFAHPQAYAITQALIQRQVITDFRSPDLIRFGITPLYTRFIDIWRAVQHLHEVIESREFEQPEFQQRSRVT